MRQETSYRGGFLPQESLNHTALILSENSTDWLEIKDESKTSIVISYYANLPKTIHQVECRWTRYDAISTASQLKEKDFPTPFSSLAFSVKIDSTAVEKNIQEENTLTAIFIYQKKDPPTIALTDFIIRWRYLTFSKKIHFFQKNGIYLLILDIHQKNT